MNSSLFFILIFAINFLHAATPDWIPSLQEGRFRPISISNSAIELSDPPPRQSGIPLSEQLQRIPGPKLIPTRFPGGIWVSVDSLRSGLPDFTPYKGDVYQELTSAYATGDTAAILRILGEHYPEIEGTPYLKAAGKSLYYPTIGQLKAESFYFRVPLIPFTIFLYSTGIILLLFFSKGGRFFIGAGFLLHTVILLLRCYILDRPPVSNMFETVIYVPWISVALSLLFDWKKRQPVLLVCGALSAIILMILLKVTGLNEKMENVQAVLDSQFWLLIHVLLVVGSYGIFILAGVLAHVELIRRPGKIPSSPLLPLLYLGTVALIGGTILGGIWAAQSWGRFWDWDPKESWAFISSCVYLLLIHAYRFGKIGTTGLAVGAIIGLIAISFTWYGVNYILGTGLHSYGFGNGGEGWYYLYVAAETAFLIWVMQKNKKSLLQN
jgi:ABC-type transport system involved in cytochrome c biogenesis permease subunit